MNRLHSKPPNCEAGCDVSRRAFLQQSSRVVIGGVIVAALPSLPACGFGGQLPVIANSPSNQYELTFASFPQLQNSGGSAMVQIDATSGPVPVAVVRTGASPVVALLATCTHASCTVGAFDSGSKTFTCPCHGSVYSETGAVLRGPAFSPLSSLSASVGAASVTVTVS